MSSNNLPSCAFCGQKITEEELNNVKLTIPAKLIGHEESRSYTHYHIEGQWGKDQDLSHEDCWEGRNSFAPARRRIIQIGGTKSD